MHTASGYLAMIIGSMLVLCVAGCSPEVGSEQWCADIKEKPSGDWTANEAADYAKHCVL